jgi:hypothetical protein
MKNIVLFLCVFTNFCCYGKVAQASLDAFIRDYVESNEKKEFDWPEVTYALEKDYDDDIVLFCLENFNSSLDQHYQKEIGDFWSDKYFHHLAVTSLRKNRLVIFNALVVKMGDDHTLITKAYEVEQLWDVKYHPGAILKSKAIPILNIVIEECDNSLELVDLLIDLGVDINQIVFENLITKSTTLVSAINKQKLDVVGFLIEKGANDFNKYLGMRAAIRNNDKDAVILLLASGVIPDKSTVNYSLNAEDPEIADLIIAAYFNHR